MYKEACGQAFDDTLEETYQLLEDAADAAYTAAAADIERFLQSRIGPYGRDMAYGRIDVDAQDGDVVARYRTVQQVNTPNGTREHPERHVLLDDKTWDEQLQEVYAPLAASCAYVDRLIEREDLSPAEQRTIADVNSIVETGPNAEDAATIHDALYKHVTDVDTGCLSHRIVPFGGE